MELEGLRGIAAIAVVLYHCLQAFYPFAIYGGRDPQHLFLEDNFYGTPLAGLASGAFAVAIFFVLSGFVLSIGYFQKRKASFVKNLAIKRYVRLMIPALVSTLLCLAIIKLGLFFNIQAGNINGSHWLFAFFQWPGGDHNLLAAIHEGTVGVFTNFANSSKLYNPVLWTMTIEFVGSFIVFGFLLLFAQSRLRWIVYTALFVVLFNTWIMGFIFGMLLADLYSSGRIRPMKRYWALLLVPLGLLLGAYPRGHVAGTIYGYMTIPGLRYGDDAVNYQLVFTILGATVLVLAAISIKQVTRFLAAKPISGLGKYTFSLYLTHLPVFLSFTTGIFVIFSSHMGYNSAAMLSLALSVPVFAGFAVLFEKYVDMPSIQFSKFVANVYTGKEELHIQERLARIVLNTRLRWRVSRANMPDPEGD